MKKLFYLFVLLISTLSCTEKIPIKPEYTGNTNWVPAIGVYQNSYHRFSIGWPFIPRIPLPVQRNISEFLFELSKTGETQFTVIDSQKVTNVRSYPHEFTSKPILEENVNYETRMTVRYLDGTKRSSNIVDFTSAVVRGKILRRIYIPDDPSYYPIQFYWPKCIGFDNGYLYGIQGDYLTRVDTTTEEVIVLKTNLSNFFGIYNWIDDFDVFNNSVYIVKDKMNYSQLLKFNLTTLEVEDTVMNVQPDSAYGQRIIANYGSELYALWSYYNNTTQVIKLDSNTGDILETYPRFYAPVSPLFYFDSFAFDGSDIWITNYFNNEYLNRIGHFDPMTGSSNQNENQVPIFEPSGLTWDGAHFWVFDSETRSYVKIGLEGI